MGILFEISTETGIENTKALLDGVANYVGKDFFTTKAFADIFDIGMKNAILTLGVLSNLGLIKYGKNPRRREGCWVIIHRASKSWHPELRTPNPKAYNDYQAASIASMYDNHVRPTITPFNYRDEALEADNLTVHTM